MSSPIPDNEEKRLEALKAYNILDTLPEQAYDDFTYLAAQIVDVPIALISLLDEGRQWFKSKFGLEADETSREYAFCAHTIMSDEVMVVEDATKDFRFSSNPLVTGDPNIRFYAGAPLATRHGFLVGTVCAIDREPRDITENQKKALEAIARQIMACLELRRTVEQLAEIVDGLKPSP